MSIGMRLTLWYSSVLAVGLGLFVSAIWIATERSFHAAVDESLVEKARGVAALIDAEFDASKPEHLREELSEYAAAAPQGNLIAVRDDAGRAVLSTKGVVIEWPASIEGRTFRTASVRDDHYRILALSATPQGRKFDILVAMPLAGIEDLLRRVRDLLLAMTPIVLLLASLGGYWLSRRALAPVDDITTAARSISIQNLSSRLKTPQTGDELQRLSETWNDMLDRLESAVKRLTQFTADAS